jgi:eukaryotic-like serine/threonine-protein kinase
MQNKSDYTGDMLRHYHVLERIGGGGQGVVYKAQDTQQDRIVAMKVIRPGDMKDAVAVKRFQMEAAITFRLKHPCIVPIYDYWTETSGVWMVMRWFEGGNLRKKIAQATLTLSETATLLQRISEAVDAAHQLNVIHRDIKPENILLDADANAYLSDFGAAKRMNAQRITKTGQVIGSPGYFAPEVLQKQPITPQVDIFSLGIVLYEALTGAHPFQTSSLLQTIMKLIQTPVPSVHVLRPDIPAAISEVIGKATAKTPAERYTSASELLAAFRAAAELAE